jgi:hypothetical protein
LASIRTTAAGHSNGSSSRFWPRPRSSSGCSRARSGEGTEVCQRCQRSPRTVELLPALNDLHLADLCPGRNLRGRGLANDSPSRSATRNEVAKRCLRTRRCSAKLMTQSQQEGPVPSEPSLLRQVNVHEFDRAHSKRLVSLSNRSNQRAECDRRRRRRGGVNCRSKPAARSTTGYDRAA